MLLTSASATFEHAGLAVTVTYMGLGAWAVDATVDIDNGCVVTALRTALRLAAPFAAGTRVEIHASHVRRGVIANNTYPPTAWWYDVDPGAGGVASDLEAAIWKCLAALRLRPSSWPRDRARFADPRFSRAALDAAPDAAASGLELAHAMEAWLGADASLADASPLLEHLAGLGHAIFSFDDDGHEFVVWGTSDPSRPRGLQIQIFFPAYAMPTVSVTIH